MSETNSSKVFKGLRVQTLVTVSQVVIHLAYFSIMSRLLSKEDFGYFGIITAVTFILSEISNAGLGASIVQRKEPTPGFISTAFGLSVLFGTIFSILLFIFASTLSYLLVGTDHLYMPFCLMSVTLLLSNVNSATRALFSRKLEFLKYGIIILISSVLSSLLGIGFAYYGYGLYAILIAVITNYFFIFVFSVLRLDGVPRPKIIKVYIRDIVSYGGWLTFSAVIRSLYEQIDRLITTRWISVALLGTYVRSSGFVINASMTVNGIFDTILFPILSKMQDSKEQLKASYLKSMDLILIFSFVICSSVLLSSELLITIFLGSQWLDTLMLFQIVALSMLFHPFAQVGDSFFRSIGIVKQYFFVRMVVCIASILFVFLGCTMYGITGLAIAYVLGRVLDFSIKTVALNGYIKVSAVELFKNAKTSFLIVLVLFAFSFGVKIFFGGVVGCIVGLSLFYLAMLLALVYRPYIFGETFYLYVYGKFYGRIHSK